MSEVGLQILGREFEKRTVEDESLKLKALVAYEKGPGAARLTAGPGATITSIFPTGF